MNTTPKLQIGQGMTEYIIILSLVAVAAITVFSAFGGANRAQVAAIANEIAGNHEAAKRSIQLAQNYAKYASDTASYSRNMGNYNSSPDWSNYSDGGGYGAGSGGSGSGSSGTGSSGTGGSGTSGSGTGGSGTGSSGTGGSGTGGSGTGSSGTGGSGTGGSGTGSSGTGSSGTGGSGSGDSDTPVVGAPTFVGQVATQSAVNTSVSPSDTTEIYKGLTIITKKGGNNTAIKKAIDLLPSKVLTLLVSANIKVVAVKDSVTEYFTDLAGTPRGYLPGTNFNTAPAVFKNNTAVITTSGKNPSPSVNVTLHELGHAFDKIKGYLSRKSEFKSISASVLPGSRYFSQPGNGGLSESFAESFAQYHTGYTKINSKVKDYWEKQ